MDYHLDARMPRPEQCVQRYMIERWAREQPHKVFAIFADGEQWTYADMQAKAIRTANALRALGVKQGERVLVWLPNSADGVRVWFGLNYLGAVFVPINTAYRGTLLEHAIGLSEARLMIAHADRYARASTTSTANRCARLSSSAARPGRSTASPFIPQARSTAPTTGRRRWSGRSRRGTCSRSSSRPGRRGRRRA